MYCRECGSRVNEGDRFCENCGTALNKTAEGLISQENYNTRENEQKSGMSVKSILVAMTILVCIITIGSITSIILLKNDTNNPTSTEITSDKGDSTDTTPKKYIPIVKENTIGYISSVFDKNGQMYLMFDDVLFLTGDEAINTAKEDGNADYDEESDSYYVPNDYYTVNKDKTYKEYEIAQDAEFYLLGFDMGTDEIGITKVEYTMFQMKVNSGLAGYYRIYTENNVIRKVERVYTP